jgi:hypothetical protein
MADIKSGRFKAKAIKGSVQYGDSSNGKPQIGIDLFIKELQASITTFLYFSPDAAQYSYQRLTLLGWKGKGPMDLPNMEGIDTNEVEVEISESVWDGRTQYKVQILTGPGRVTFDRPVDKNDFARRVAAMTGSPSATAPSDLPMGDDEIPF